MLEKIYFPDNFSQCPQKFVANLGGRKLKNTAIGDAIIPKYRRSG
jgi:hypothetical protein